MLILIASKNIIHSTEGFRVASGYYYWGEENVISVGSKRKNKLVSAIITQKT